MMQDMLVNSLRSTGTYKSVSRISSNLRGDYVVRGHLIALDEIDSPGLAARFSFQIELYDPKNGQTIWTDTYMHDEPVTGKKLPTSLRRWTATSAPAWHSSPQRLANTSPLTRRSRRRRASPIQFSDPAVPGLTAPQLRRPPLLTLTAPGAE